jgi:hypothetical protein
MFAAHEVTLDLDFPAARARLALLMRGDWLDSVSQDAYAEGLSGQLRGGPLRPGAGHVQAGRGAPARPGAARRRAGRAAALGGHRAHGRLFPVLDANLALGESGDGRAVLRFAGVYRPPLDGVGAGLDQIVLNRVAAATVRSLLARVPHLLTGTAAEAGRPGAPAPDEGPGGAPPV